MDNDIRYAKTKLHKMIEVYKTITSWLKWQKEFIFSWLPWLVKYGTWEIYKCDECRLWVSTMYYDGPLLSIRVLWWMLCASPEARKP